MTKENQTVPSQGILNEISGEVSEESAPLLEFITKHGGIIAGAVLLFLLIIGLSALWQWHTKKSADDYLTAMAKITQMPNKNEALGALEDLARNVSDNLHNAVRLTLADLAIQNNDLQKAAESYEACAKADSDGTVGLMAQLSLAMTHLRKGDWQEALTLLTDLEKRFSTVPPILRELTAEAAQGAGDAKRAAELFETLSTEETGDAAAYYQFRAQLAGQETPKKAE